MATVREWFTKKSLGLVPSVRPTQANMADQVEDIIENGGIAFLEAGTGTGKSLAYGVPAVLSDKRVVIATAKKALQEQLVSKDLPRITSVVKGAAYALLKGKQNYLCGLRYEEFLNSAQFANVPKPEADAFAEWVDYDRAKDGTGDLSQWNMIWQRQINVNECIKKHCPHAEGCGYVMSRSRAAEARVIVVNHALLAHDLALGGGKILGAYDVLIIDEAHQAPKFFRDAFSLNLNSRQPEVIARMLKDSDFELGEGYANTYAAIFNALPNRSDELQLDKPLTRLFGELYAQSARVYEAMEGRGLLDDGDDRDQGSISEMARIRARLRSAATMLGKVRKLCEIVLDIPPKGEGGDGEDATPNAPPAEWVRFTDRRGKDDVQVIVTPLEIGPLIAPPLLGLGGVVVTSATLATTSGMAYMAREYGLSTGQIRIKATHASPFDYENNSLLYVSSTSPDPSKRDADYYAKMCIEVHELLEASQGGAFVLCASTDDMKAIHDGIYRMTKGIMSYRLSQQTVASPELTMKWFLADPTSVLVGLKTYWEGVDVPGDYLRLVVIPRLPFPNEGDVLLKARKRAYAQQLQEANPEMTEQVAGIRAWEAFSFQEAIMDLKQGAGRLIRKEDDHGIVALLDKRAYGRTKNYSASVRNSLPHPAMSNKGEVLDILRGFGAQALAKKR